MLLYTVTQIHLHLHIYLHLQLHLREEKVLFVAMYDQMLCHYI